MPAIFTHLDSAKGALGGSWQSWSPATRPGKKGEAASYLGLATLDPPFASNLQRRPSISSSGMREHGSGGPKMSKLWLKTKNIQRP